MEHVRFVGWPKSPQSCRGIQEQLRSHSESPTTLAAGTVPLVVHRPARATCNRRTTSSLGDAQQKTTALASHISKPKCVKYIHPLLLSARDWIERILNYGLCSMQTLYIFSACKHENMDLCSTQTWKFIDLSSATNLRDNCSYVMSCMWNVETVHWLVHPEAGTGWCFDGGLAQKAVYQGMWPVEHYKDQCALT